MWAETGVKSVFDDVLTASVVVHPGQAGARTDNTVGGNERATVET